MDQVTISFLAVLATLVSVIVTATFNYFNLVNTKEAKISEFRQKWVDSLREEVSAYVANMASLLQLLDTAFNRANGDRNQILSEHFKQNKAEYEALVKAYTSIQLRIHLRKNNTPTKEDLIDQYFHDKVKNTYDLFHALDMSSFSLANSEVSNLVKEIEELNDKTNPLLKYHWELVKKGEKGFTRSKSVAFWVIMILLITLIIVATIFSVKANRSTEALDHTLLFDTGKSELTTSSLNEVVKIAGQCATKKGYVINVISYTDKVGRNDGNSSLSLSRCDTVKGALIAAGVPERNIFTKTTGETFPPIVTTDSISEPLNRRVDVIVR